MDLDNLTEAQLARNVARALTAERAERFARALEEGETIRFSFEGDELVIEVDGIEYARIHKFCLYKPDDEAMLAD
jgi:hypothetical protein